MVLKIIAFQLLGGVLDYYDKNTYDRASPF